ncbi:MAG: hypothetical protein IM638_17670 [Bacteroidetes bacterium]|nr:hypothetical protein [Bacteroidota bacterium]
MKKSTLIVAALAFGVTSAFAQDLTSKKGEPILPEAGDWAIGVDATPFLDYFGNFIGGNGSNYGTANWAFTNPFAMITGKMFVSPNMAYRGMLRIGFGSETMKNFVTDDASTATPPATVTDEMKVSGNFIGLGGGLEWRRGKTRLQGYYGGMAMVMFGGGKTSYSYGNAFSSTNTTPTTTSDFLTGTSAAAGSRITEDKSGSTLGFGVRGFIGAEYFVLPKLSVGGEFGWGLALSRTGDGEQTVESWNGTAATSTTTKTAGGGSFGVDTDNANFGMAPGALFIHFHF